MNATAWLVVVMKASNEANVGGGGSGDSDGTLA